MIQKTKGTQDFSLKKKKKNTGHFLGSFWKRVRKTDDEVEFIFLGKEIELPPEGTSSLRYPAAPKTLPLKTHPCRDSGSKL